MERNIYLNKLIRRKHNKMIKVITGIRRCGKSYLLFELFKNHLLQEGVEKNHIIAIALDDRMNKKYRDPDALCSYVHDQIKDEKMYYVLLDEVQMVDEFEDVLNSFLHIENVDTYVTGSNAKFLSKDIITEFRGRGFEVKMYPLNFKEYMSAYSGTVQAGFNEYMLYGGLPQILSYETEEQKVRFLKHSFGIGT